MAEVKPDRATHQIVVHDFDQALAALRAADAAECKLTILSAPMAVRSAGAGWWRELVAQLTAEMPHQDADWILDCGDEPGMALAALREGIGSIALDADEPVWSRVAEIAAQAGARLVRIDREGALDLAGTNNPQRTCELYLSRDPRGVAKTGALG